MCPWFILVPFFLFCVSVTNKHIEAAITLPKDFKVPAMFGFGDSIIDPGNNNNLPTLLKCNFLPYGKDFMGGTPTGRFCNGKIPTDMIAIKVEDLITGVSFASGGAGYDPLTSQIVTVIGLTKQISFFKEYILRLKTFVGDNKTSSILSDSFYVIVAGSDDIANTYFNTPLRKYIYDIHAYTNLLVQKATTFAEELYDLGARRVAIFSAPPIGCVPAQRTLQGGIQRECGNKENEAVVLFNSKLSLAIDEFNIKIQSRRFVYVDIYTPLLDIIRNPHHYGFKEVNKGCCGTGKLEAAILCNNLVVITCPNVSDYVFWDSYHPTEKSYEALVNPLLGKYLKYFL